MTDRISAPQLAEIEKRANDATEGPWRHHIGDSETGADWHSVDYDDPSLQFGYDHICNGIEAEDAAFIAAARSDVPALIAEIRAAWGEAEAATRALRDLIPAAESAASHSTDDDCALCQAVVAARALVGSENREADDE